MNELCLDDYGNQIDCITRQPIRSKLPVFQQANTFIDNNGSYQSKRPENKPIGYTPGDMREADLAKEAMSVFDNKPENNSNFKSENKGVHFNYNHIFASSALQNLGAILANNSNNSYQNAALNFNKLKFNPLNYLPENPNVSPQALYGQDMFQKGGVIKDDNGQWAHPGEVTEINSNNITMQGVPYPVFGVSDAGDMQMMFPGNDYKFKGKSVTEYPMLQKGGQLPPIYTDNPNDPRLRAYSDSLNTFNKGRDLVKNLQKITEKSNGNSSYADYYTNLYNNVSIGKTPKGVGSVIKTHNLDVSTNSNINVDFRNTLNSQPAGSKWKKDWEQFLNIGEQFQKLPTKPIAMVHQAELPNFPIYQKPVQPVIYQEPELKRTNYNPELAQYAQATPVHSDIKPINIPKQDNTYRVEYTDPETGKDTHMDFPNEKLGSQFQKSIKGNRQGYYLQNGGPTTKNCRGKCWKPTLQDSNSGNNDDIQFLDGAPVSAKELVASGYDIADKKVIKQYAKDLQDKFPGLTADDVAMAMADSARVKAKLWNFEELDKNIAQYNKLKKTSINDAHRVYPYSDYFYKHYRPNITVNEQGKPNPLSAPEILSHYTSPEAYKQTVKNNYITPQQKMGGTYEEGGEYELTDEQIESLRKAGYNIEIL